MKKIAVYGKGGIGKSTVVSNMSAALSAMGYTVMQIGCDPKSDSTRNLMGGQRIPTVLETMRDRDHVALEDIVLKSECGVYCVESGGPIPGVGCVDSMPSAPSPPVALTVMVPPLMVMLPSTLMPLGDERRSLLLVPPQPPLLCP